MLHVTLYHANFDKFHIHTVCCVYLYFPRQKSYKIAFYNNKLCRYNCKRVDNTLFFKGEKTARKNKLHFNGISEKVGKLVP